MSRSTYTKRNDDVLGGGDHRYLLPAWLSREAAAEVLTAGTYDSIAGADSFSDINGAFRARR